MMPSNKQAMLGVNVFGGVKQVDPSFDNVLQEVHGCSDRPAGILKRFNGKLLNTTGVSSPVWSIGQLRFSDRITNVRRTGSSLESYPDYSPLPPVIPLIIPPSDPPPPIPDRPSYPPRNPSPFDPGDYPADGPKAPAIPAPTPEPAGPAAMRPAMPWDVKIRCVPDNFSLNFLSGPKTGSGYLEKYYDVSPGGGFWCVQASWPVADTWISLTVDGDPVANGDVFTTTWTDGSFNTFRTNFAVAMDGTAPTYSNVTTITFTLVAYTGLGTYAPLKNMQGANITATCDVTTINPKWWPNDITLGLGMQGWNIITNTKFADFWGWGGVLPATGTNNVWYVEAPGYTGPTRVQVDVTTGVPVLTVTKYNGYLPYDTLSLWPYNTGVASLDSFGCPITTGTYFNTIQYAAFNLGGGNWYVINVSMTRPP